jgi:hypothetical protein
VIFHDFRRRAVRNLERTGVSRSVAMKMTGHKTEAVYRRYAIVSEADLHEAAAKLGEAVPARMGTITGTNGHSAGEKGSDRHSDVVDFAGAEGGLEPPRPCGQRILSRSARVVQMRDTACSTGR